MIPRRANSAPADVVVVGGGIVGCAAAAFLADAAVRVTLIDRDGVASGASGANSGVVQHPFDPVLAALYRASVTEYHVLSGEDAGFRLPDEPAGMLFVAGGGMGEAAVRRVATSTSAAFPVLAVDVLDPARVRALEPALAADVWACRVDVGYPVPPAASTYAYATLAERRGVRIRVGREAALTLDGDRVAGVVVDGERIGADAVLVAAGPWTPGLIDPRGTWAPVRPLWGVVVEARLAAAPRHVLEEAGIDAVIGTAEPGAALAANPGAPGDVVDFSLVSTGGLSVVGSTFLENQPEPRAWMVRLLEQASRFVPALAEAPLTGVRACARPSSADGRPLVGRIPWLRDLYVCAGHGAWGISTGPGSARLVADLILGRAPAIPRELDPRRFGAPVGVEPAS